MTFFPVFFLEILEAFSSFAFSLSLSPCLLKKLTKECSHDAVLFFCSKRTKERKKMSELFSPV